MFKDEYKKALDNLHPEKQVKENIEKILEEDEKKVIKVTFPYKRIIAVAASLAIVLGAVYFGTKAPTTPTIKQETSSASEPKKADIKKGYKELYKVLSSIKEREEIHLYTDDKEGFKEETIVDDAVMEYAEDITTQSAPNTATGENKGSVTAQSGTADKSDSAEEYSSTNTQFEDVDEADVVKTDGKYIYVCKNEYNSSAYTEDLKINSFVKIYKADGKYTKKVKSLPIENKLFQNNSCYLIEAYVNGNRLIVINTLQMGENYAYNEGVQYTVYDTSTPEFKLIGYGIQEGDYCSSRMADGKLYIVTNKRTILSNINQNDISTYVPAFYEKNEKSYVSSDCIIAPSNPDSSRMLVVGAYDAKKATQISSVAVLGGGNNVYMDSENLIVSEYQHPFFDTKNRVDTTDLLLFKINDGKIQYKHTGRVKGSLLNQFSMDVYNGCLRVCTTVTHKNVNEVNKGDYIYTYNNTTTTNSLYVLSIDKMRKVGAIENLAEDERIYSARFTGDIGYFVTFRETDPLFAVDLKNPKKPKILSALKIDGFSSYLHPFGEGKLLGFGYNTENSVTTSLKLTMFDTTDPKDVTEIITETVSDGYAYSECTDNHKAIFVDVKKGWFGFYLETSKDDYRMFEYRIYEYKNDKFNMIAKVNLTDTWNVDYIRGLYIGGNFYVCTNKYIKVLKMSDFTEIAEIKE